LLPRSDRNDGAVLAVCVDVYSAASAAELIYRHFGKHVIARHIGVPETDPNVELLWLTLYAVRLLPYTRHILPCAAHLFATA
jgi:hypothetical protein